MYLNNFKYSLILSLLFVLIFTSCEQDDDVIIVKESNEMLLWQGMSHEWRYNHRVNRMGDWLLPNDIQSIIPSYIHKHSAASGSGADYLDFKSYSSRVVSEDMLFFNNKIKTQIQGVENSTSVASIEIQTEIPEEMLQYENYEVILNGFDMYPTQRDEDPNLLGDASADKVFEFSCLFGEAIKMEDDSLKFDLEIKFGADCASFECSNGPAINYFDYQLTFHYVVIGFNDDVVVTTKSFNNNYAWDKPSTPNANSDVNEIFKEDFRLNNVSIAGTNGSNWSNGITLFKGFNFQIEKGAGGFTGDIIEFPHLLSLDLAILDENYNAATDLMTFDLDLFFKNWTVPIPPLSFGSAGKIDFNADLALLQFEGNTTITPNTSEGTILWNANPLFPEPPNTDKSVSRKVINF